MFFQVNGSFTLTLLCHPTAVAVSYNVSLYLTGVRCASMADKRKLQGEIDRTLKKIVEGVEVFDDIWDKVHNATNCNVKEKHEADLKKEIKKLQRLRDFVKVWLTSSEIKDKKILLEHKKLIEAKEIILQQMERFKVVERETKTKAYSTVGLGAALKVDPKEKEKEDIIAWLCQSIEALNLQVDQMESEIESINSKKKKLDRDKQDQVDHRQNLERHRYHIGRLELTMRLVDNDALDINLINKIREDVEFYISDSREPNFECNEFVYDDLHLDEVSEALGRKLMSVLSHEADDRTSEISESSQQNSGSPSPSPILGNAFHSKDTADDEERSRFKTQLSLDARLPNGQQTISHITTRSISTSGSMIQPKQGLAQPISLSSISSQVSGTSTVQNYAQVAGHNGAIVPVPENKSTVPPLMSMSCATQASGQNNALTSSTILSAPTDHGSVGSHVEEQPKAIVQQNPSLKQLSLAAMQSYARPTVDEVLRQTGDGKEADTAELPIVSMPIVSMLSPVLNTLQSMSQNVLDNAAMSASANGPMLLNDVASHALTLSPEMDYQPSNVMGLGPTQLLPTSLQLPQSPPKPAMKTIQLHPLLGVAPLGPQPLDATNRLQLVMLEAAASHLPMPADSERVRAYFPRNPVPVPPYYCQLPPTTIDSMDFFSQLDIETLFFIFYYMEGTKAQYMAAKALKLKSWRFHTKHLMWFQRHEEPKIITEEFEQGSYLFFDYEKWMQRQQDSFTFEYKYLEDQDLN